MNPPTVFGNIHRVADSVQQRVLLIGDSNIFGVLGREVEQVIRQRGADVVRFGKPTSGLARPDFFDWTQVAPKLIQEHRPDVVIIMFGGNDGQRLAPYVPRTRWIPWEAEAQWRAEYGARIVQLAHLLRGSGRQVWFLSPTNRRPRIAREKMKRVIDVQRAMLRDIPDVRWIDVFTLSSDDVGNYLAHVPSPQGKKVAARRRDGIHLSNDGGRVICSRIIEKMDQNLRVPGEN